MVSDIVAKLTGMFAAGSTATSTSPDSSPESSPSSNKANEGKSQFTEFLRRAEAANITTAEDGWDTFKKGDVEKIIQDEQEEQDEKEWTLV